ncbi:MAG: hypothetical protein VR75_04980 [Hyphomonadaceae bacterium BRH_c29]|nr:MAG: hypothetical protein VR75_04980 [Hyphomonadaceae bacterium BRH_c29]
MYDAVTTALIQSTPALPELDRESLPDRLSRAYAEIAAARVRLREDGPDAGLEEIIDFATRLAQTNEALVAISPDRDDRASAAFVAATAYQLIFQAERVGGTELEGSVLWQQGISSSVSAMLLFLIGDATADAIEVSKHVGLPAGRRVERELVRTLRWLARGEVRRITDRDLLSRRYVAGDTDAEMAASALYYTLLRAVRSLATSLLGGTSDVDPVQACRQVQQLSHASAHAADRMVPEIISSFSGPHQLASLLLGVVSSLDGGAVVTIPSPPGTDPGKWRGALKVIARTRPYLWPNHRDAITQRLLETGVSAAVGFPTGAGKSTVSQLKIAAHLFAGRKVVFLAPTHALVDQTSRDLRSAFPRATVRGERIDEFGFDTGSEELPDILVMTPEACLTLTHFEPTAFDDVGLLVFDECHLLHDKGDGSRRAIDAMLCLLNVVRLRPEADLLLLSAMVKNVDEIAAWMAELTGRKALGLALGWKPTRQLRGCIVYEADTLEYLEGLLKTEHEKKPKGGVPQSVKAQLTAQPFGFFSVKQTWASMERDDYACLPFLDQEVALSTNANWKLTPNANELSAHLAARAAQSGLKTLVFSQSTINANSIANQASDLIGAVKIDLTDAEKVYLATALDEIGSPDQLYLAVDGDSVIASASVHHAQLLPEERRLVESLYKRREGLTALAATPTLGQGMNLPSEMVIIADDSRFDEAKGRKEVLEAQDLLNAAGRAGRAGQNATGIVIVIPGKIVALDESESTIGSRWTALREVFGQSDQCLEIDDPLTALLDRIHAQADDLGDTEHYAISRLLQSGREDGADPADDEIALTKALRRSFAAYRRKKLDEPWIETRIFAAVAFARGSEDLTDEARANRELSSTTGVPEDIVAALKASLQSSPPEDNAHIMDWSGWMMDWLDANPDALERVVKYGDLESQFGKPFKDLASASARAKYALPRLRLLLRVWMAGKTLNEMQAMLPPNSRQKRYSTSARKFVMKIIPSLAYLFGVPALILRSKAAAAGIEDYDTPPNIAHLGRCVRRGYDSVEKSALAQHLASAGLARRALHRHFGLVVPFLAAGKPDESWGDILDRVEHAMDEELNNRTWDIDDLL